MVTNSCHTRTYVWFVCILCCGGPTNSSWPLRTIIFTHEERISICFPYCLCISLLISIVHTMSCSEIYTFPYCFPIGFSIIGSGNSPKMYTFACNLIVLHGHGELVERPQHRMCTDQPYVLVDMNRDHRKYLAEYFLVSGQPRPHSA